MPELTTSPAGRIVIAGDTDGNITIEIARRDHTGRGPAVTATLTRADAAALGVELYQAASGNGPGTPRLQETEATPA